MRDPATKLTGALQAVCLGFEPVDRDEAMARVIARYMSQYSQPKGAWKVFIERVETQMKGEAAQ